MQYWTCPLCGANLDSNEKCDCMYERVRQQDYFSRHLKVTKAGQLAFTFAAEMMEKSITGRRERK